MSNTRRKDTVSSSGLMDLARELEVPFPHANGRPSLDIDLLGTLIHYKQYIAGAAVFIHIPRGLAIPTSPLTHTTSTTKWCKNSLVNVGSHTQSRDHVLEVTSPTLATLTPSAIGTISPNTKATSSKARRHTKTEAWSLRCTPDASAKSPHR
jgi:hypothetical protein